MFSFIAKKTPVIKMLIQSEGMCHKETWNPQNILNTSPNLKKEEILRIQIGMIKMWLCPKHNLCITFFYVQDNTAALQADTIGLNCPNNS